MNPPPTSALPTATPANRPRLIAPVSQGAPAVRESPPPFAARRTGAIKPDPEPDLQLESAGSPQRIPSDTWETLDPRVERAIMLRGALVILAALGLIAALVLLMI